MRITAIDGELDRRIWRDLVRRVPPDLVGDHRLDMTERDLQDAIVMLAGTLGWLHYHTTNSRRSEPGFPDLVLVNPPRRRTLYVELKSMKGTVSQDQARWLTALAEAGNHVYLYTPVDWITGGIERELRGPRI